MRVWWMLALAAAVLPTPAAEGPGTYVIRDARIVRVSAPVLERGTVVVRDGLIESVGETVAAPAGGWILEGKGLTVYPGLVDALSSWGIPGNGNGRGGGQVERARGPEDRPFNASWVKAADQIAPGDRSIQTARDGGFTTAVSFPRGNIFSGQGSVFNLAGDRAGEMVIADSVAQLIRLRVNTGRAYPESLMGAIGYVRQIYLDADHYKTATAIYRGHPEGLRRPAYDRALEGVLQTPLVLLPADTDVEIERMLALAKELKLHAILYGGHEAGRAASLLKQEDTAVLVSLRYPERARDADPAQEEPLRVLQFRENAPGAAAALARSAVKFAFYSDGLSNPRDLLRAVRKAVDRGLSEADAIRALTLSPAEIYGLQRRIGSIDAGKIADLVVTDGDLLGEKTRIRYVFVDGKRFEPLPEGRGGAE